MTSTPRRPRPSAESLERAIEFNQRALAEHRRAAGRTLNESQVEALAQSLLEKMAAPAVRETAMEAKVRRLQEAAVAEPAVPLHKLDATQLNAYAAGVWDVVIGPMAG